MNIYIYRAVNLWEEYDCRLRINIGQEDTYHAMGRVSVTSSQSVSSLDVS